MGSTTTPTITAAHKDKCEGVVVESELTLKKERKKKEEDLVLILLNRLVFSWQTPKAVLPTVVGYPSILP